MRRRVEDEFDWPPELSDAFGMNPELVDRLIEKLANTIHGGTPNSGSSARRNTSPLMFHFWRSAVAKLKYWLE